MDRNRILAILRSHAPELQAAGLAHLRLFGSVARGDATPQSDIGLKPEDEYLCPGPDWRKIRGMGNILRHDYEGIEADKIWNTVRDDLPSLKAAVTKALATHFPSSS